MSATRRTSFYWSDWLGDPAVRRLTLEERGLWIDLLALAAGGTPAGYVTDSKGRPLPHEEIARISGAGSPVEVAKLIGNILEKGAASRDRTGRLFNRRMARDAAKAAKLARNGKLGGDHTALIHKGNKALLEQMVQQSVKQKNKASGGLYLKKDINLSSENSAAREQAEPLSVGDEKTKKQVASPLLAAKIEEWLKGG